jgi:hypothetical protein
MTFHEMTFHETVPTTAADQPQAWGGQHASPRLASSMRAKQRQRIRELRTALIRSGFVALDQQTTALGLSRSTTWAVLQGNHKCTGLRAALIARMLASPMLPDNAREILLTYIAERAQGIYGHGKKQRRRFVTELQRQGLELGRDDLAVGLGRS